MSATIADARSGALLPLLGEHRFGSLFSSPPWIEALARSYGLDISASACLRRGRIESAILFSHVRDLRGDRVLCLPFSDYCDPMVDTWDDWDELIQPLLALQAPVRLRCLRNDLPDSDRRLTCVKYAKWHGVDLSRPEDEIWAGLSGSARQNIRRAERSGVVVREGRDLEDVRLFHRMHAHLRKTKYRMLAQPAGFFEALFERFGAEERLTVLLAEADGVPIAGLFLLQWGDTLYYKFNASLDQHLRPNDLLVWHAILMGRRRGLLRLDFGISDIDQPGLIRYKAKFATEEKEVRFLELRPEAHRDLRGEQASHVLGHVTGLLTDPAVPDELTQAASSELYRFFC